MAPQPKDEKENTRNIVSEERPNTMIMNEVEEEEGDDDGGESSDENENSETEYAGYKLLSQDDLPNGIEIVNDQDDGSDSENGESDQCTTKEDNPTSINQINMDIDYKHLTCGGLDEDITPKGMGFPDVKPEYDASNLDSDRDDNIDMGEDKVKQVKSAMAGFSLPVNNIPDWAKSISEDKWVASLTNSVSKKKD